jgi:hypothetical protein
MVALRPIIGRMIAILVMATYQGQLNPKDSKRVSNAPGAKMWNGKLEINISFISL